MADDDFSSLMRLVLYHSQIYGLSPIRQTRRKDRKWFEPFRPGFVYGAVLSIGLFCSTVFTCFTFYEHKWETSVFVLYAFLRFILAPVIVLMILASSVLSSLGLCQVLNRLSGIDLELQKHVTKVGYRRMKLWMICVFVAVYAIYISQITIDDKVFFSYYRKWNTTRSLLPMYIDWFSFDVVKLMFLIQITVPFYSIKKMLFQINRKLKREFFEAEKRTGNLFDMKIAVLLRDKRIRKTFASDKLVQIRELHVQLLSTAQNLNDIFATRIFLIVGFEVISICFCCFIFATLWLKAVQNALMWTVTLFSLFMRLFVVYGLILPFCFIVNEVSSLLYIKIHW